MSGIGAMGMRAWARWAGGKGGGVWGREEDDTIGACGIV